MGDDIMDDIIMSDKDVQRLLGFSSSKMQIIRNNRIIPFIKIGKSYIISKKDFELWLSQNTGKTLL